MKCNKRGSDTQKKCPSCMNTTFTTFRFTSEIPRAFQSFNIQLGLKCIYIKKTSFITNKICQKLKKYVINASWTPFQTAVVA